MDGIIRNYTFRINSELLEKFHYVSRINGRSANMQILIYVQKTVERYESDNGPIEVRGIKYTPSKKLPDEKRKPGDVAHSAPLARQIKKHWASALADAQCSFDEKEKAFR